MLIKLYPENPAPRHIKTISECLLDGGIIIYPTDTVYSFGCAIDKVRAVEKIARIKHIDIKHHNFSLVFEDLSRLSDYVKPFPNNVFRVMKKALPGPYTFILNAKHKAPKLLHRKKTQVGIRIPDNSIVQALVVAIDKPMLSSSVHHEDGVLEYRTDPELIYERWKNEVDIVVDGGYGDNNPSTIIDCTADGCEVIREGKGSLSIL